MTQPEPYQPEHGKVTTYKNWACRCDSCRAANTAHQREARARRAARLTPTK